MHKRASRNALSASKFFELICINLFGNPVPLQNTHIILYKIVSHPVNRYATNIPTNSQERVSPLLSKKVQTTIIRNLFPINEELCSKGYKHYKRGPCAYFVPIRCAIVISGSQMARSLPEKHGNWTNNYATTSFTDWFVLCLGQDQNHRTMTTANR